MCGSRMITDVFIVRAQKYTANCPLRRHMSLQRSILIFVTAYNRILLVFAVVNDAYFNLKLLSHKLINILSNNRSVS